MPAGIMIQPSSMAGSNNGNFSSGFASSSGLTLGQPNMMEGPLHSLEAASGGSDGEMPRLREEDFDSKSGSQENNDANNSGEDQEANNQKQKRKRYHRHTQRQIQEMEAFFKECPHPDDKQRKELSRELGLEPLQVKFWFQNKRTQMKIDRISGIAAKYVGKPFNNCSIYSSPESPRDSIDIGVGNPGEQSSIGGGEIIYGTGDIFRPVNVPAEEEKPLIVEHAVAAMEELIRLAQMGEPLWLPNIDRVGSVLNEEEYVRAFPRGIGSKPQGFKTEATREATVVIMSPINLVETLMDPNEWANMFAGIVSRAMRVGVLSMGAGNYNGALQVMKAEFQLPSPLVPTRESYFVRYSKQRDEGTWAVVDVSLEDLCATPFIKCRRRPSGCVIEEMSNGYSKVTWIEHQEVDDRDFHNIYKPLVNSGLAFGAKRWVAILDRQSQRLASALATNYPANGVHNMQAVEDHERRRRMMRLAERMVISFCGGVGASTANTWTTLNGHAAKDVRVMTRNSINDPGHPSGIVLNAATSFWLPLPPKRVFDFLRDRSNRNKWDILSNGGRVDELDHIASGQDAGNYVSILRVDSENSNQSKMVILQESSIDSTGCFVIYAPVHLESMCMVLDGGNPDYVALLPSGFAILPDGPPGHGGISEATSGGSLLTAAFQILVDSAPTAKLSLGSIATVNNLITCTIERIKNSLAIENA